MVDRFWESVRKTALCWIWIGRTLPKGYGLLSVPGHAAGTVYAHRYSWELHFGAIPDGMFVCHRCDNPSCVRPDHLFLGTDLDNKRDMVAKGRQASGERLAHRFPGRAKLTIEQVQEIRQLHAAKAGTIAQIGARFGIAAPTVAKVVGRTTWKHVP